MSQQSPIPEAVDHFAAKLRFETDPADLAADRAARVPITVLDVRSKESYDQGRIPGAIHLRRAEFEANRDLLDSASNLVVYCWGPGCNGSTRAALELSRMGYPVKELIGGFEYWAREGLAVETSEGRTRREIDPLVAPIAPPVTVAERG